MIRILRMTIAVFVLSSCLSGASHLRIRKEGGWPQLRALDIGKRNPTKSATINLGGSVVAAKLFDYSKNANMEVVVDLPLFTLEQTEAANLRDLRLALRKVTTYPSKGRVFGYKIVGVEILGNPGGPNGYGPEHTMYFLDETGNGQFSVLIEWPSIGFQLAVPNWLN